MNKTISINISGLIFNIDEDAYAKLSTYLQTIRGYFSKSEGQDEIMADIEARIAEMLQEKVSDKKQVISEQDIQEVIEVMGEPEAYLGDEEADSGSTKSRRSRSRGKRLYRDPDDHVLGGVCSGIGYYFGFEPVWLRIAFVAAVLFGGTGIPLYILLWIIIPKAKTATEKLEMKGENVNASNIGKVVQEEMDKLSKQFDKIQESAEKINTSDYAKKAGNTIEKILNAVTDVIKYAIKLIGKILGGVFLIFGISLLTVMVLALTGLIDTVIFTSSSGVSTYTYSEMGAFFFSSDDSLTLATIGVIALIGVPLISIIYGGLRLILGIKPEVKGLGIVLFSIWFIGLVICGIVVSNSVHDFAHEEMVEESIFLSEIKQDTLTLDVGKDIFMVKKHRRTYAPSGFLLKKYDEGVALGHIKVDIEKAPTDTFELVIKRSSHGSSYLEANKNASEITHTYNIIDNRIIIDPYYTIPSHAKYRDQEVRITLLVPEGKAVHLSPSSDRIIHHVDNTTKTWDHNMVDHTWTMLEDGLTCIGCELKKGW